MGSDAADSTRSMVEQLVIRSLEHPNTNELTVYKRYVCVFCVLVAQRLLAHTVACVETMQPANPKQFRHFKNLLILI